MSAPDRSSFWLMNSSSSTSSFSDVASLEYEHDSGIGYTISMNDRLSKIETRRKSMDDDVWLYASKMTTQGAR